jgi:hypothetical protein
VYKELYTDDECRTSIFGQALLNSGAFGPASQLTSMYWAVAVATETEYETAVADGNGSPGFDVTVIADTTITGVVQETWPREQPAPMAQAPSPPA